MDGRSGVEYVLRRTAGHAVRALPIGALTKGCKGEQLAEAYDLVRAGAVALSDDQHPVRNARLMLLALQYALNFNGRVMSFPLDPDLVANGLMHEGDWSVRLGMRGIPALAEQVQLARDLALRYPTADQMLYDLEHYIYHSGYGPTNETMGKFIRELVGPEAREDPAERVEREARVARRARAELAGRPPMSS